MRLLTLPLLVLTVCSLTGCGVNPVTGKKEIQFVSEAQEIKLGEQNYSPMRQSEGGDMSVMPDLTAYINEIGQRLAAVADRKLPYEFVVLNNSVPNAWALPGGKIAINRGLLTELKNEAELAAVIGHEIVHAAARHGAKAQERGTMMQVGLGAAQVGAAVAGVDATLANLVLSGAGVGAQMVQMKYGRDQELESDEYGMKYMKKVGYDPTGAITLQETFVRLSGQSGQKAQSFIDGLFASHPPSPERVAKNKVTAAALGVGGELGVERYAARIKPLLDAKPAYDKLDQAQAAAQKKDLATAKSLTTEAARLNPREGRFHEFLGEIALAEKQPQAAVAHYQKAIELNPNYFGSYLGAGVAQLQGGNKAKAQEWLERSAQLLPTAPAAYYLGNLAKERGDTKSAMQYYQAAAGSQSSIGKAAAGELVRMDLPQNPGNYVATGGQYDGQGQLIVVVQNRAPTPLKDVQVTPVLIDGGGRIVREGQPVRFNQVLKPGEQAGVASGIAVPPEQQAYIRFRVDGAKLAE